MAKKEKNLFDAADDIYQTKNYFVKTVVSSRQLKNGFITTQTKTYIPKSENSTKQVKTALGYVPSFKGEFKNEK